MNTPTPETTPTDHEAIAGLAYALWEQDGRQSNRDLDYWLRAEQQFQAQRNQNALVVTARSAEALTPMAKPAAKPAGAGNARSASTPRAKEPRPRA